LAKPITARTTSDGRRETMSDTICSGSSRGAFDRQYNPAAFRAADWLALAAAPTFAIMALMTAALGSGEMLCLAAPASRFGGMVPMYLLMSAFHTAPWLKLIARPRQHRGP